MITGVILAGGQSRRMGGKPKALLPFPKRPLIQLQLEEMSKCCDQLLVITHDTALFEPIVKGMSRVIPDMYPGLGPLGGLVTAMTHCKGEFIWLVGCDMPYISSAAAIVMKATLEQSHADAIIPVEEGMVHPLHAIYHIRSKPIAEAVLAKQQFSMMTFLSSIAYIDATSTYYEQYQIPFNFTVNMNTPSEYEQALPSTTSSMRFQRETLTVAEAQSKIAPFIRRTDEQLVNLPDSYGRYLARDIFATQDVPHFRRSGYDGYAVRAIDTQSASHDVPMKLRVIETIACGSVPKQTVTKNTAARIMTGAAVPEGADAVIMLEMTDCAELPTGLDVHVKRGMKAGDNITPVGQEIQQGTAVIASGSCIHAGTAALLATFGYMDVPVYQRPSVAIFATGSELLEVRSPLENGKIRNSNSYMIAAQVTAAGGQPIIMDVLSDDATAVKLAVLTALDQYDMVVTTGGVSVGDYDVMVDLFNSWDGRLLFNKIAMRPGSPTSVGVHNGKLLFALSGNPSAGFVGFELFVRPIIAGMMGANESFPKMITASLAADFTKPSPYPRYVRGVYRMDKGTVWVEPIGPDKSSVMVSLLDATCLIVIPAGGRGLQHGDQVQSIVIRSFY
ncbi:MAG: gephyrin-like molybdotransferase Glp [Paenibacillaceae bacterium]